MSEPDQNNTLPEVRQFFKKLLLFLLPLILVFPPPFFVFYFSGELTPMPTIVEKQRSNNLVLYGPSYFTELPEGPIRPITIHERQPKILALGDSRVLQFRSKFFKDSKNFYNGGGLIDELDDFKKIIAGISIGAEPKLLLMDLEQDQFISFSANATANSTSTIRRINYWINGWRKAYFDFFLGKYSISDLLASNPGQDGVFRIGLNARANNNGMRNDGSYFYGKYTSEVHERPNFDESYRQIREGAGSFAYANDVAPGSIATVEAFLGYAKSRGIYVIGFLPPFPHAIYTVVHSGAHEYGYLDKLEPLLAPIFKKYGYAFYNFSDLADLGATDKETIDGLHVSEKATLRLFIKMAEQNFTLQNYVDLPYLKEKLAGATGAYNVFGNEF